MLRRLGSMVDLFIVSFRGGVFGGTLLNQLKRATDDIDSINIMVLLILSSFRSAYAVSCRPRDC